MINLPPKLIPSELLSRHGLSPLIDELLHDCRALRVEGRLPEAERRALDAAEASREVGAQVSHGAALVHLGDVYREMGKLGPALTNYQKAHRIFQHQAARYQRHNEGVAGYALGLVHQLLGNDMDALKWYQQAGGLFEQVKDDWVAVNALEQVEIGASAQRWMKTLSKYLTEERARADANLVAGIRVPIILLDTDKGEFAIADLEIDQYAVDRRLRIDGKTFRVQSLKGRQRAALSPGVEYYAREIPDAACEFLGAGEGDYALVVPVNSADKEGLGVLETLGGPEFGKFERDDTGQIVFARPDAAAIVIGSEDIGEDLRVGYITALLKPA